MARSTPMPTIPKQKGGEVDELGTSVVTARLARGRAIAPADFADVTAEAVADIGFTNEGALRVTFAGPLSSVEVEAVERRIMSRDPDEEKLRAEAAACLSITNPTEAQRNEQMDRLTRITLNGPTAE